MVKEEDGSRTHVHVPGSVYNQHHRGGKLAVVYVPFDDHPNAVAGNHSSDETFAFDSFLFIAELLGIAFCVGWILVYRAQCRKSAAKAERRAQRKARLDEAPPEDDFDFETDL